MPDLLRRTRIVATVGPSSQEPAALRALIDAGVDVVRVNASHADRAFYETMIPRIRSIAAAAERNVAILLDLRGPKIRVGRIGDPQGVELVSGAEVYLRPGDFEGDVTTLPCTYDALPDDVHVGDAILLDDGLIELEVLGVRAQQGVRCRVINGGVIHSNKGLNVPGRALSTPAFGAKDLDDLDIALPLGVDFVALSFVRSGADVRALRLALHERGYPLPIIAKIEKPQAIEALDEILRESDAVMVARGDLGVEVPLERVPRLQKRIIARANAAGLPVITATQMLESMMHSPRPTRAEASDVANAIFDGTDAVMLSGETAAGQFPVEAVRMMDRIAREAEASSFYGLTVRDHDLVGFDDERREVALAASGLARALDADCMVVYTLSGTTARVLSKLRPRRPVLAFCPDAAICRRMALMHGIVPVQLDYYASTDDLLGEGDRVLLATGLVKPGDCVIVVGGTRQFPGVTNMIQVRRPGEPAKGSRV